MFNQSLAGYKVSKHTLDQMLHRHIKPKHVEMFLLKNRVIRKFPMSNGTTRLVLNKTKILKLLDNIDILMPSNGSEVKLNEYTERLMENKQVLQKLYKEGGITAVVNERQKVLVTVY